MRLLTTNLLNLTRRDDGIKPEIETLDSSFFDKVFTNYATIAEESEKGFTAQNQVGRSIKTDKTLMKQLMTILFDNAIKYTPKNSHIVIRTEKRGKQAIVSISDDGNGIADEIKPRIFDMFYSGANQIADSRRSFRSWIIFVQVPLLTPTAENLLFQIICRTEQYSHLHYRQGSQSI